MRFQNYGQGNPKDIRYFNDEGQLHRIGGPAVIETDGYIWYFVNGACISNRSDVGRKNTMRIYRNSKMPGKYDL